MATHIRVVHQQLLKRSILVDKVDRTTGSLSKGLSAAQQAKQAVYVPYSNPADSTVAGYIDMVPTDEVLLAMNGKGTLAQLVAKGHLSTTAFNSSLTVAPAVTAAAHTAATPIGGQTGVAATIATAVTGVAQVTGLTGMTTGSIGHDLVISNAAVAANNGTFKIVSRTSATQVGIANPAATSVGETNNGSLHWTEQTEPLSTLTGTTFSSLAPDHTYVTLTNLSKVSQTLTDTAIIAAGTPSSFATTSIVIADSLVTIGTPTTGWTIKVFANSKLSNVFTM